MEHTPVLPAAAFLDAKELFLPSEAGIAPLIAVASALRGFNREQLGSAIEVLIALLDVADGNPDEEDGNDVEDDFVLTANAIERATSCPAVDCVDQDEGAYVEWHTRGRHKLTLGGHETTAGHEDEEEDDPSGQCSEDEISYMDGPSMWGRGPGCQISDPDAEQEGF